MIDQGLLNLLNEKVPNIKLPSTHFGILALCWITCVTTCHSVSAELLNYAEEGKPQDPGLALLQEDPHDIVYLKEESGGGWIKAHLIDFPGRRPPSNPGGNLKISILGIETKDFVVNWNDIKQIDLWEERLERETKERITRSDFVGAYPFLSVLIRDFPSRKGLRELRSDFLWKDAISRAKRGELSNTLVMLEELRNYAPEYKRSTVLKAMSGIADKLVTNLVGKNRLDQARQLLGRLQKDYQNDRLPVIPKWTKRFIAMAKDKQDLALSAFKKKDYRSARKFIRQSNYVEPELEGNARLMQLINKTYPVANVGVLQTATVLEPTRIDNWAARRAGRLIYRVLFEIQGAGPEGGEYDFIFGDSEISADRMQFDLTIEPEKLRPPLDKIRGFFLADVMADRAKRSDKAYFAPWAAAVNSIGLDGPEKISFTLKRPHVLPISLLQIPVDGGWFGAEPGSPTGDYRLDLVEENASSIRYKLSGEPRTENQPREIVETRLRSGSEGVGLLLKGELDVVDQLFPSDAIQLQKSRDVKVARYPLPTVHMLVPCSDHLHLAERTFRRALLYAINRDDILKGELLGGREFEGCRVLSGPFPAGIEINDPLGYAYDNSIVPRSHEPSLAKLLLAMNNLQMKAAAERKREEPPELQPIRLGFPADNLSRVACEAIRSQWEFLDLEIELIELPVGRTFPHHDEDLCDICYVSAAVWEPVIDARRILGPEGLAKSQDQLVGLGLRRIEEARNWRGVRDGLIELHRISHHELPILPLWQMVDSFAYRRDLIGVGSDIVSLYQNADNWRIGQ